MLRCVNGPLFHPPDTMPGQAARGPAGCQEKRSAMGNKNSLRQWYIDHKICVCCRRRNAFNGRQKCPECLEKATLDNIKYRSLEKERIYYQRRKEKRETRKASGLCTVCGRPAIKGQFCLECYVKRRKRHEKEKQQRASRGDPRRERVEKGLCWFCDSPALEGKKVCQKHYDDIQKNFHRGGREHPWSKDETARRAKIK